MATPNDPRYKKACKCLDVLNKHVEKLDISLWGFAYGSKVHAAQVTLAADKVIKAAQSIKAAMEAAP